MKRFIVYDKAGEIKRYGCCPRKDFELQASDPDELVMEGSVTNENHVIDGVPVYVEPPPPPEPTEEEKTAAAAEKEAADHAERIRSRLPDLILDIENRLRTLEGKKPVTAEQFRDEILKKG